MKSLELSLSAVKSCLMQALYYLSMTKVYDQWINKVTTLRKEMRGGAHAA